MLFRVLKYVGNLDAAMIILILLNKGYLPLLLAIYDYWYIDRRRSAADGSEVNKHLLPPNGGSKYLLPAICLSIAYAFQAYATASPRSTYICPLSSNARITVPSFQILGLLLDLILLIGVRSAIGVEVTEASSNDGLSLAFLSPIFLLSSFISFLGAGIALATNTVYWVELFDVGWSHAGSTIWLSIIFCVAVIAALHIMTYHGLLHWAIYVLCNCVYCSVLAHSWADRGFLAATTQIPIALFLGFYLVGLLSYLRVQQGSASGSPQRTAPRSPSYVYITLVLLVTVLGWAQTFQTSNVLESHPIDLLMRNASEQSHAWLEQASRSDTLAECVEEYRRRYQRHPPPGFDGWYTYATTRSSVIIDDYDTIVDDLKPFWGISPAQIRLLSRQVVSDPFNEVSEVVVRNGRADLGPDFLPTHRWMLDGVLDLIKEFSHLLPDMDLAFNLNDEPRVAVPHTALQRLRDAGSGDHVSQEVKPKWGKDRAKHWLKPHDVEATRLFKDHSRTNTFSIGSIACPATSYAQRAYMWDPSTLCTSCAAPHSHGVFLSNWSLAASPCHQPDLRNLHGFYLSPAAYKPSHQLLPIFSQSKVEGYADILYPSPWNYIDKVYYNASFDLPFAEKENTLFWRGATSEGVSRGGTWKGMSRQRAVHLSNNLTTDIHSPTLPLLLPHPSLPGKYNYQTLPTNPISALNLSLNISIVDGIARAWDNDGVAQDAEFGFAPPTSFQDHWRYRYLLDIDGAGYSGRFLPFLQSKSLPFRTGIFRAWWDGRLTAWRHFVPIDVRLHGLFSTLAYFMGAASPTETVEGIMRENMQAGEEIAEAGRVWAEKVLRKEDMEIYMFRLLLEWGRLTDDARDEIGYMGP